MPNEPEPCDMTDCCRVKRSCEDEALDDLIRRALEASIKRDARPIPPFTMTPAEMRAEAERRQS